MRRETQNVLLVLLGGALLRIAWSGTYLRYVKPSLLPLLVAAGLVIVGLALAAIVRDVARHGATGDDHGHRMRSPWLLVLPVLAIFLVAPPALGADRVNRADGSAAAQRQSFFPDLPDGPAPAIGVGDFVVRAVWDESGSLVGREVRLTGFAVHDGRQTHLARLVIRCCAADSAPVKVRLVGAGHAGQIAALPQDAWFEVRGRLVPGSATAGNRFVPTFDVVALRPVPAPREPYEY